MALPSPVFGINVSLTIAEAGSTPNVFSGAAGIIGLAYSPLEAVGDYAGWLAGQGKSPLTYPWPLNATQTPSGYAAYFQFLNSNNILRVPVAPFMTQFAQEGILSDKFALWVSRSQTSLRTDSAATDNTN